MNFFKSFAVSFALTAVMGALAQTPVPSMKTGLTPSKAPPVNLDGTTGARPVNRLKPAMATSIPAQGIHLQTELGSFKIKRGADVANLGALDLTFQGTVLVSGLVGNNVQPGNGVRLDYSQPKWKKQLYYSKGIGSLHIQGQFDSIQFFGQHVNAHYRGSGVLQMFGEFDKNLNTGTFWYDQTPATKNYWGTNGMTITPTPQQMASAPSQIKVRDVTGKG